jgi:uncharacterized damage-inducible protein DinB
MNDFLTRHAPVSRFDVSAALLRAREGLAAAGRDTAALPDGALEKPWSWRDHEADVRYGAFRGIEAVEEATAEIAAILAASGAVRGPAALRIAPASVGRWALHGRLLAVADDWLDRVPKAGEWTLRETLGHIVGSQRGYTTYTTWHWLRNRREAVTEAEIAELDGQVQLPEEAAEAEGSIADIRRRLDETTDESAVLAGWSEEDLARPARWSGIPVDIGFRLGRPSSHLMEHSIQVDKTLAWLDHRPTEGQRIAYDLCTAWGRLETHVFPMEPAVLAAKGPAGRSVDDVLDDLARTLPAEAASARAAAGA